MQKIFHIPPEKQLFLQKKMDMIYTYLDLTDSTNAFLLRLPEQERAGNVVWAGEQTAGKGMASNGWESAPNQNLTFSIGLDLSFMKAADQFLLSQAVPLGLLDVLDTMGLDMVEPNASLSVKWPNDLYAGSRKLCGILINSTLHGQDMGVSVVGIGLNVNQLRFHDWPTHPVSLRMLLGRELPLEPLLRQLVAAVGHRVQLLKSPEGISTIKTDYLNRLYRYRTWGDYEVEGRRVKRFITGIDRFGRLETLDESGTKYVYDIKEIAFK